MFVACNFHYYKLSKALRSCNKSTAAFGLFGKFLVTAGPDCVLSSSTAPPSASCVWGSARLTCSRRPRRGGEARATEEAATAEERATRADSRSSLCSPHVFTIPQLPVSMERPSMISRCHMPEPTREQR